ncbi:MAG: ATP-dependent DNA helicase RecG, partial [Solobacterium sp.]|nr:ATP-dependent DNA helicase RecG [Solobacterium sp.]
LRGRIQRGSEQGYCWLLSDAADPKTIERLDVLVKSNNGFEISYEDLRLRGPGDILGTRQSGVPDFILGNIVKDTRIIETARKDAADIVRDQANPGYAAILDSAAVNGSFRD